MRVVRLVNGLPRTAAGSIIARQLARSGTSVGANIEEAQGAQSKKDFTRRMNIARAEAREALYWLRVASAMGILGNEQLVMPIIKEADELIRILTAIVKRSKGT